jgi:mediator of RNA polymerase II transcription subunit 17
MNKEGNIFLDPDLAPKPRTLRVRISDHGRIVGSSRLSNSEEGTSRDIEKTIRLAHDSLFEEEIFQEMAVEARSLLPYGVQLRESILHVRTSSERTVLIDCILLDDDTTSSEDNTADWLAHIVAEGLRLLLAHEHRMRLFRRTQIPPPLTLNKRHAPSPPLLRTLLAMFSHINAVDSLQRYLQHLAETLSTAGLEVTLDMTREASWESLGKIITESPIKGLSLLDQIIEHFVNAFDSVAKLSLPSIKNIDKEHVTIAARTFFGPQTFGTEYKVSLPPSLARALSLGRDMRHDFKFSTGDDVRQYIDWIYSLHLSHTLLRLQYSRRVAVKRLEPSVTISVKDGKKILKKEVVIEFTDGVLTVTVGPAASFDLEAKVLPQTSLTWNGREGDGTFLEKIKGSLGL